MNKEIADLWVTDLRTNPKQYHGALGNEELGHCCLGRLCVILNMDFRPMATGLPPEVRARAGMKSPFGQLEGDGECLANMNDGTGKYQPHTFSEIADIIEKKWDIL